MKILQLCHKPPHPLVDGGCVAINNITDMLLKNGQDVKVVAVETPKHPVNLKAFPGNYLQKTRFESVFIDTTPHLWGAFKTLFTNTSYQISRFYSKQMASLLAQIFARESFDIVHIESIYMMPYIPVVRKYSKAPIVMRMHNIEHEIWERLAQNERNPLRKLLYKINAHQLERVERKILQSVDGYLTISSPDYQYFHSLFPATQGEVLTFGIDFDKYEDEDDYIPSDTPSLFHLGSMNWSPNVEGIEWFLDEVWPEILKEHPELVFTIAGHHTPESLYQRHDKNVVLAGSVPDANEFMLEHDIMVVPLLSGSGIRIKIIEGMALGKVVVTTTVGAQGLDVENGKHLFIADTPEEFVAVINKCVATPDLCSIIGENAREFISVHHNNNLIQEKLINFYQQMLKS
ncbi:MAG: glycosyltransferase family 4 protein [Bacteroidales bacterium]|nr:glycosyltransferase family 4 protein [Bacteroidales bacterium]